MRFLGRCLVLVFLQAAHGESQPTPSAPIKEDSAFTNRLKRVAGLELGATKVFFDSLVSAVKKEDRRAVASLVEYPIHVELSNKKVSVKTPKQFMQHYSEIITQAVKDSVASQIFDSLFINWQGVMIGNGQVWFSGICSDDKCINPRIKIIAINQE